MSKLTKEEIAEYSTKVKKELLPALKEENTVPESAEVSLDSLQDLECFDPETADELRLEQKIGLMLMYASKAATLSAENPLGALQQ